MTSPETDTPTQGLPILNEAFTGNDEPTVEIPVVQPDGSEDLAWSKSPHPYHGHQGIPVLSYDKDTGEPVFASLPEAATRAAGEQIKDAPDIETALQIYQQTANHTTDPALSIQVLRTVKDTFNDDLTPDERERIEKIALDTATQGERIARGEDTSIPADHGLRSVVEAVDLVTDPQKRKILLGELQQTAKRAPRTDQITALTSDAILEGIRLYDRDPTGPLVAAVETATEIIECRYAAQDIDQQIAKLNQVKQAIKAREKTLTNSTTTPEHHRGAKIRGSGRFVKILGGHTLRHSA